MKPLVLTGWLMPEFTEPEFADLALSFFFRFGWGPLPSPDELATYLGPGTQMSHPGITGRTLRPGGTGAETGAAGMPAWPNSVSNTKPSNYGSTCGRVRN